ncbi:hypothetical protein OG458_22965 [Streptomyces sp. NBC_01281]|uniref:hypothetical protein n=1 Tax=Streptomyces sp. NBC_01281 TaxID=2903811 RepID=UPI002E15BEA8|nr:hypothetical protein OG458_22965 [Streptomyces sp. NBC_01281]
MTEQTTPVDDTRPAEDTTSAFVPQPRSEPLTPTATEPAATEPAATEPAAPGFVVPPPPVAPPLVGEPQEPPVKVKKDRRVLRAVLRWTAATVVFAAVGASAAYGITRMERTDVPGLATEADGRWDYPAITKPPLPSGSPGPFAGADKSGVHSADLRALLLPAPKGAKADASLRGDDGWLSSKAFLSQYAEKVDRETVGQMLTDYAVRHIAARGWTTPDGTRTRIYLLQFDTAAVAEELASTKLANYGGAQYALTGAATTERDEHFPAASEIDDITRFAYTESKPYGPEQVREAYLSAGDTIALVVQSHKGTAPAVPFQQTVVLQSQLLD